MLTSLAHELIPQAHGAGVSLLDGHGRRTSAASTSPFVQEADNWQYQLDEGCLGTALISLPTDLVARWALGGFVVEYVSPAQTRITISAWLWAGVAGLVATFDADLDEVEPDELRHACRTLARRS